MDSTDRSIRLYSFVTSPYGWKVHTYLLYKRLSFDLSYISPVRARKELPLGHQIPVLQIGNEAKADSSSIGIWLDQQFPDSPRILPADELLRAEVMEADRWISDVLIPTLFYSEYPVFNRSLSRTLTNTLKMGSCIHHTSRGGLHPGLRLLWPLIIRQAGFIKRLVLPLKAQVSVGQCRAQAFEWLESRLQRQPYIVATETPSLADLSAWPQLYVPHALGLKGMDDYLEYPSITRWEKQIRSQIITSDLPPLIPASLR
ncbi:MAG: glutathione S-transferase family protein [Amphritea sp.]